MPKVPNPPQSIGGQELSKVPKVEVGVHGFRGSEVQGLRGSEVQGFRGSRVQRFRGSQGSILVPGLHLGCVFTRKASVSLVLIQNLKLNAQLLGKMNICNEDFGSSCLLCS
jgi:hypothetical protein